MMNAVILSEFEHLLFAFHYYCKPPNWVHVILENELGPFAEAQGNNPIDTAINSQKIDY